MARVLQTQWSAVIDEMVYRAAEDAGLGELEVIRLEIQMQNERRVAEAVMRKVSAKAKVKQIEFSSEDQLLTRGLPDIGIKSLQLAIMLTALCADLKINMQEISDLDIVKMRTVADVIDILASKATAAA